MKIYPSSLVPHPLISLWLCVSVVNFSSVSIAEELHYRAGVASVVITPGEPMWLAGYSARDHASEGKVHDLWAKALAIEDPQGRRVLFVTTDLLGLPKGIADSVAATMMARFHLERSQICLTSSHTHCGPVLHEALVPCYDLSEQEQAKVANYSKQLQVRLVEVAGQAIDRLAPARLSYGVGTAGFAMNRRENDESKIFKDDKLIPGYTPKGPVDHDVPVLRVEAEDGKLRAVLFGYACHNTTMAFYKWCGDYAGFAQIDLEKAHPGATAMFFMGCGGDQNPLPRRKLELCEKYGRELAEAVEAVLKSEMKSVDGPFKTAWKSIDLPFAPLPTREDLQKQEKAGNAYEKRRAARYLAQLDAGKALSPVYPYPVQAIQIGKHLTAVVLAGEVVIDYSKRLKAELGPGQTWMIAYANDVPGYIPSRRVLKEGRYEGHDSMALYGLPTVWAPEVEEMIVSTVRDLVKSVRQ